MDPDSIGDRLKEIHINNDDNMENVKESMEEKVPKILSPELNDVFHIFANMLDIKSFVKLSMASKKMYKRCTEDKDIKINLYVEMLDVSKTSDSVEFKPYYNDMLDGQRDFCEVAARKFPCKVHVHKLEIMESTEDPISMESVLSKLKELKVYKIDELVLYYVHKQSEAVITIIKDFGVKSLNIHHSAEADLLRSIFQLNLEKLHCGFPVTPDYFMKPFHLTTIPELSLPYTRNIRGGKFEELLSVYQWGWGPLRRLRVASDAIDWRDLDMQIEQEGKLPDGESLYFKYWNGCVTKCTAHYPILDIYKCEPWEVLYDLRSEENVLKNLAEKRPTINCSSEQFRTFITSFTTIDRSHKGPLPETRPLVFLLSENHYWMLDESENLMECCWKDDEARWSKLAPANWMQKVEHPALAKCMFSAFIKHLKEADISSFIAYREIERFNSWLDGFEMLDFEYSGPLPSTRPLVFECESAMVHGGVIRIVLLDDDRLLQCDYFNDMYVNIEHCHYLHRPPILMTAKDVVEMLRTQYRRNTNFNISFEIFRNAMELLNKRILVLQKRLLISEKTETEFWYMLDGVARKAEWKEGRLFISEGDLRGAPPCFAKQVFRYFAEKSNKSLLTMDLQQFLSCLEQFITVPFEYSGSLTFQPPLAFLKDVSPVCEKGVNCQCAEPFVLVWFLWHDMRVTRCSWGEHTANNVLFEIYAPDFVDIPDAIRNLKKQESLEKLKNLLEAKYDISSRFEWVGRLDDFYVYFKDNLKLTFDYKGSLPKKRPLLFEMRSKDKNPVHFVLRDDGTIIKCSFEKAPITFSLAHPTYDVIPPVLHKRP